MLEEVTLAPPPPFQIILSLAFLKPKNLDLVLEKGTELGATAFYLFPADKSEKKSLSETQLQRLRYLTISALKQCGRLDLPRIEIHPPLKSWIPPHGTAYFGDLSSEAPPLTPTPSDQMVFIGPEGGFSKNEEDTLRNHLKAKGIRLNPNILRAETAAICALSQLSHL